MRILLKLTLDCPVDEAFDAITDPRVLQGLFDPVLTLASLEPGGFPERWREGDHEVAIRAFGVLPLGTQVIGGRFIPREDDVRMLRDVGPTTSGILSLIDRWEHTLAVSPLPDGRTLYRDRLRFSAGPLTLAVWAILWPLWQWRGARLRAIVAGRASALG